VKVRITRQRMVGEIARHSGADIAAGVTPGRPWHVPGPASYNRADTVPKSRFWLDAPAWIQHKGKADDPANPSKQGTVNACQG